MLKLFNAVKEILWKDADNAGEVLLPMEGNDIYLYV